MRRVVLGTVLTLVCTGAHGDVATPKPPTERLQAGSVPAVLIAEWRKAENRASCAPLWLDDAAVSGKQIRARYFGGGWGVTVRNPRRWGVAGAGVVAGPQDLEKWKFRRENAAGMRAGYGLEGFDMGPDWLAYILVPGQSCLYNVWSSVGKEHLEELVDHLRIVDVR
jgi:hypothetical protein